MLTPARLLLVLAFVAFVSLGLPEAIPKGLAVLAALLLIGFGALERFGSNMAPLKAESANIRNTP